MFDESIAEVRSGVMWSTDLFFPDLADWHIDRDMRYIKMQKILTDPNFNSLTRRQLSQLVDELYPDPDPEKDEFLCLVIDTLGSDMYDLKISSEMVRHLLEIEWNKL